MSYGFPLAHAANTFAMTVLMIVLALCGRSEMAVEVGLIHAATLITFQAFSGDARSLLLRVEGRLMPDALLRLRLMLALPLAGAAWLLSAGVSLAEPGLAAALILRRIVEWIAEIHLAECEYRGNGRIVPKFIATQSVLLIGAIGGLLTGNEVVASIGLFLWAAGPLLLSGRFAVRLLGQGSWAGLNRAFLARLLPHFGSTLMIAVAVYAFRAVVVALVGKAVGGNLITAYSLGGLLASVFAIAAGPSLTFQQLSSGRTSTLRDLVSPRMALATAIYFAAGVALCAGTGVSGLLAQWTGSTLLFWRATGASLCGGAVMLFAARMRFRVLQSKNGDVLGPDVLANLVILLLVPVMHQVLKTEGLVYSYLVNGIVCLVFQAAAVWQERLQSRFPRALDWARNAAVVGLFVPIFFQLSHGIFQDPMFLFDAKGRLSDTPFPFSIAFCYAGLLLIKDFRRARAGLFSVFLTSAIIVLATLISSRGQEDVISQKMLLGLQFLLPMPAFILGQAWGSERGAMGRLAKIGLGIAAVMFPMQLWSFAGTGVWHILPKTPLFSVYQAVQYVSTVLISLYLISLFRLFDHPRLRIALMILAPVAALYAGAALSLLALALFLFGTWLFVADRMVRRSHWMQATSLALISTATAVGFIVMARYHNEMMDIKYRFAENGVKVPVNLIERLPCWKHYAAGVVNEPETWLAGHRAPPSRFQFPSAHNYVLDFAYNLGIPALFPVVGLVLVTLWNILRQHRRILSDSSLLALTVTVLVTVFLDNQLKVGLRQPYPGIAGYFLWGVLAAQLAALRNRAAATEDEQHAPETDSPDELRSGKPARRSPLVVPVAAAVAAPPVAPLDGRAAAVARRNANAEFENRS